MREEQTLPEMRDRLTPAELAFEWRYYQRDARDPSNAELLKFFTDGFNAGIAEGGKDAGWRDIETAPQSSEPLLSFNENGRVSVTTGYYLHNMMHAAKIDKEPCFYTHWMPLPSAPTPPAAMPNKDQK